MDVVIKVSFLCFIIITGSLLFIFFYVQDKLGCRHSKVASAMVDYTLIQINLNNDAWSTCCLVKYRFFFNSTADYTNLMS